MQTPAKKIETLLAPGEKLDLAFGVGSRITTLLLLKALGFLLVGGVIIAIPIPVTISRQIPQIIPIIKFGLGTAFFFLTLSQFFQYLQKKAMIGYGLTDRRIIIVTGWLVHHVMSVDYMKITNVEIDENLSEKMMYKTGTIKIFTENDETKPIELKNVENYLEVQKIIYSHKGQSQTNSPVQAQA